MTGFPFTVKIEELEKEIDMLQHELEKYKKALANCEDKLYDEIGYRKLGGWLNG